MKEFKGDWQVEPEELNKNKRIGALGNSIVPQIAFEIFKNIDKISS